MYTEGIIVARASKMCAGGCEDRGEIERKKKKVRTGVGADFN